VRLSASQNLKAFLCLSFLGADIKWSLALYRFLGHFTALASKILEVLQQAHINTQGQLNDGLIYPDCC
jgi:hypothetical protein